MAKVKPDKSDKKEVQKQKSNPLAILLNLVTWLTGILVALAVGFGMIEQKLTVMWIHPLITVVAGWIVVVSTLLSVILAVISWVSKF